MADSTILQEVEKAIHQLYSDPTLSNVSAAEKWLFSVQQSREAWSLSWQLLSREKVEVQNFGALILKNKLAKSWSDITPDQYESLRYQLLQAILKFENGPRTVLTQLCIAMVTYAFHTLPEAWPNCITSVITTLASSNNFIALLELLKVFPEEFEETNQNTFVGRRALIRQEMKNGQLSVFTFLEQILSSNYSSDIKLACLQCLNSWTSFTPPLPELRPLINLLFQLLLDLTYTAHSIDVLINIIIKVDNYKYPNALKEFQIHINQLNDFIQSQLNSIDRDMDTCCSLCCLVTEALSTNVKLLVEISEDTVSDNAEECVDSLTLLLGFTTLPGHYPVDEKCSEISFAFWDKFLNNIEDSAHSQFLIEFYHGILMSLIEIFPIKARFPSEEEWSNQWDEDEQDLFAKYRDDLWDLADSIQEIMSGVYVQHLSVSLTKSFSGQSPPTWQEVEAVLYLLQGAAGKISDETSIYFENALSYYQVMPSNNMLAKSALRLLGSLCEWFKGRPDILTAVLPMILNNLTTPSLAASSALAFRDICSECQYYLVPALNDIITSCQDALSSPNISYEQCSTLVSAVSSVLSSLSLSTLSEPLNQLLHSRIETLQLLASQQPSITIHAHVKKELTVISSFSGHLIPQLQNGEQHPVMTMLVRTWPSLKSLLSNWIGDMDVVTMISTILLRTLRTVGEQYYPLLPDTLQIILQCFSAVHYPKLLDTASEVVRQFGQFDVCQEILGSFLRQFLMLCFHICQHGLQTLDPDTVKSLLELLKKILDVRSSLLINMEGMINNTFTIGLASLGLSEQQSISSASLLMVTLINLMTSSQVIRELIITRGVELVEFLLRGVAGGVDRSRLDYLVNILHALSFQCITELSNWLQVLLSKDGFPTQHATVLEKQVFRQSILRERGNRNNLNLKIKEFSLICRGFHGTLYATETSQSLP